MFDFFLALQLLVPYNLLVGAKVLKNESSGGECSRERKFQGAKVPQLELSLPEANGRGIEKSSSPQK